MRLVLISDTHGLHDKMAPLPEGDVLVHAGDLTNMGKLPELRAAGDWLRSQLDRFRHVVLIAGNHDWGCEAFLKTGHEQILRSDFFYDLHYLRDSEVILDGRKFYGSPWQPEFCNWAFNLPRGGRQLQERWAEIPLDTDVLVTHGPPLGILDHIGKEHVGCSRLRLAVGRVQPKVHVFGHIHNAYGSSNVKSGPRAAVNTEPDRTKYYNASICDENYRPTNAPWVVDI